MMATILVAYGSLTGNTQAVAARLADGLQKKAHIVTLKNFEELEPGDVSQFDYVLVGSSTWDIGQLPFDTQSFFEKCKQAPLPKATFAAFGCGDVAYEHTFCSAVDDLTDLFTKHSGICLQPGLKIDGFPEFDDNIALIEAWLEKLLSKLA